MEGGFGSDFGSSGGGKLDPGLIMEQRMTDKCFRKCIGKPGGSLDNSEQPPVPTSAGRGERRDGGPPARFPLSPTPNTPTPWGSCPRPGGLGNLMETAPLLEVPPTLNDARMCAIPGGFLTSTGGQVKNLAVTIRTVKITRAGGQTQIEPATETVFLPRTSSGSCEVSLSVPAGSFPAPRPAETAVRNQSHVNRRPPLA
ncbi:mitochondrial import inner membrane translocase subunit Tim13 isoform X2 [Prionailurus bengalensis]|uniref:mitochondrial import inner membrane translocase subunit Tim13 isoform X2 n=1 Tax=Prionailurus bengalensis TaxID=37029 RepID=UPI001CA7E765|nr:mitochondrial import inner membrane translocase subunit Tim13 isoform X2 [Prionailurus bengalensis]